MYITEIIEITLITPIKSSSYFDLYIILFQSPLKSYFLNKYTRLLNKSNIVSRTPQKDLIPRHFSSIKDKNCHLLASFSFGWSDFNNKIIHYLF